MRKTSPVLTIFIIIFIMLFSLFSSSTVFAEGDGSGENKSEPLELASCNIQNAQTNVDIHTSIDMVFSKNVVHMSVAAKNKACFQLLNSKGESVLIAVVMGDDQIDPSIKRNVSVVPTAPLAYETKYTLLIKKSLSAKSGSTPTEDIRITFTTEKSAAAVSSQTQEKVQKSQSLPEVNEEKGKNPEDENPQGEPVADYMTESGITTDSSISDGALETEAGSGKLMLRSTKLTYIVLGIAVVLAVVFVVYFRKR